MAETEWLQAIRSAEKVALVGSNTRKIHYKFKNGKEMVEEYNLDTGILNKRIWKSNVGLRKEDKWEVEVGDSSIESRSEGQINSIGIQESKNSPYIIHRVTKSKLEWRIRNISFPLEYYNVTVDQQDKSIIVRTTNKKFFKKLPILELQRLNVVPQQSALKFSHYMNTLIITYDKPSELIEFEEKLAEELRSVNVVDDGDLKCKPS